MTREQAINILINHPYRFAHMLGLDKLTPLHNEWIKKMISSTKDETIQAHRGSYKTTCIGVSLSILMILKPNQRILFMRKTDADVKEIIKQVIKILESEITRCFVRAIYRGDLKLITASATEIATNLTNDIRGTSQLVGQGINSSLTGKHYDIIFTDDIVNLNDRSSKAERDHTKAIYQELQNIKNRGGRIFNTGTPWHKDDAFSLMPNIQTYDCYSTGLLSDEEIKTIQASMTRSLFAANYEMRHVAEDDVIFSTPKYSDDISQVEQGTCHIDAAYGGEDYTAFTICNKKDGIYYVYGRLWHTHIDNVEDEIIELRKQFNAGRILCENNADKGYLAKSLRQKGERPYAYHETMNKYIKITSYLKSEWENVVFVNGTDKEYIEQICDYNENAEHDDAPDSLASIVRYMWRKKR